MQLWALQLEKDEEKLEKIQSQVTKMIKGLARKLYEERLTELDMLNLEESRLDMIVVFKYLNSCHKREGNQEMK